MRIQGFRSISLIDPIPLGPITVFVGPNNSGKSAILRALTMLQEPVAFNTEDYHHGSDPDFAVELKVSKENAFPVLRLKDSPDGTVVTITTTNNRNRIRTFRTLSTEGQEQEIPRFGPTRSEALMAGYFHDRRTLNFNPSVNGAIEQTIAGGDYNLTSRIDGAMSGPSGTVYRELCRRVFGVEVGTIFQSDGKNPGRTIADEFDVSLLRMGEGIRNSVDILQELSRNRNHIYLIEEPESNLHPSALREFLRVLIEYSGSNQFIVSTHSDVVVRYLGSEDSTKIHRVSLDQLSVVPHTVVVPSLDTFERREALEDLGFHSELPMAWIVFEESSAESVIRDFLIPQFCPQLAAVQTISCGGLRKVRALVEDLGRTILCLYVARTGVPVWTIVDGGEEEATVVQQLQRDFAQFGIHKFIQWKAHDFEEYLPARFAENVNRVRTEADSTKRRELKGELIHQVLDWALGNVPEARSEFQESATEVLLVLSEIAGSLRLIEP